MSPARARARRHWRSGRATTLLRSLFIEIRSFRQQEARDELLAALLPYQSRLGFVNVDAAGIGWYMAQHRAKYFRVQAVNVGQAAMDSERFVSLKAELYWGERMRFESRDVAHLTDEKTICKV